MIGCVDKKHLALLSRYLDRVVEPEDFKKGSNYKEIRITVQKFNGVGHYSWYFSTITDYGGTSKDTIKAYLGFIKGTALYAALRKECDRLYNENE